MRTILVTGGSGFIGTNLVLDRLRRGDRVRVLDSLDRPGSERNWAELERRGTSRLEVLRGDVRDFGRVAEAVRGVDAVFHLAAQVAVTSSVANPRLDFEINCLGTLNVLEAARLDAPTPAVIYASTNKVYGSLAAIPVERGDRRYGWPSLPSGLTESAQLEFHSPYGCSKGSADQYVVDYSRIYGLPTVSLRQSCIYGPFQYGNEDQGWVAHFAIRALNGEPITIYGNGLQVRDVLYVEDLLELYDLVLENIDAVSGRAYNVGGGPQNTVSLIECLSLLEELADREITLRYEGWRPGDQRVYVSCVDRVAEDLGWRPATPFGTGVAKLLEWLQATRPNAGETLKAGAGPGPSDRGSESRARGEEGRACAG